MCYTSVAQMERNDLLSLPKLANSRMEVNVMAKKCNPPPKVREAGRKLATSKSPTTKSAAGRKLANHKHKNH